MLLALSFFKKKKKVKEGNWSPWEVKWQGIVAELRFEPMAAEPRSYSYPSSIASSLFVCLFLAAATASLVVAPRLRGMWDLSSPTRDQTLVPCIERQSLNHCTVRKFQSTHCLNWQRWRRGLPAWQTAGPVMNSSRILYNEDKKALVKNKEAGKCKG